MNVNDINYFDIESLTSEVDLKKLYRQQSKKLHPDAGGSKEEFQRLTEEYEYIKNKQLYDADIRKSFKVDSSNANNIKQPQNAHPEDFYRQTDFEKTASEAAKNAKASQPTTTLPAVVKNETTEVSTELATTATEGLTKKTLDKSAKSKTLLDNIKNMPKGAKIAAGVIVGTAAIAGLSKKDKKKDKDKPSKREIKNQRIKNKIVRENNMKNVESWRLINNDLDNAKNISQFSKGHSSYKLN